jgi:organic hydroperoxide reductase OsmC/OhrA
MATRKARARWEGSLREGAGKISLESGVCESPHSFGSRFEAGRGTNPEELLMAAHAGCFATALSLALGKAGFAPGQIDAAARVAIEPADSGFRGRPLPHRRRHRSEPRRSRAPEQPPASSLPHALASSASSSHT